MNLWLPKSGRDAWRMLLAGLAMGLAVWLSVALTRVPSGVASLWIANGILLGVLLRSPSAHWPLLFALAGAANLVPRLLQGDAPGFALGLTAINLAEAHRRLGDPPPGSRYR